MELLDEKQKKQFLEQAPSRRVRHQMLNSLGLNEYLEMLETKFTADPTKEKGYVDEYIRLVEANRESVSISCG